ncbi:MAG: phosphoribosyl-AMP cyclohydrolase [bacterium]|nr:phosphoribosyl-AMP cyclohydrolase [bacterium]
MKNNTYISKINLLALAFILALGFTAPSYAINNDDLVVASDERTTITEAEVQAAQRAWGEGIVRIGKVFTDGGDVTKAAVDHINRFYNYQEGTVLFKPTLAAEKQFRTNFEGALSYFIGGNDNYPEDGGFAIKPWTNVRWENIGTKIIGNMAVAMGNYYFTPADGSGDVKVEYSFAYTKNGMGELKIILHDSHVPFSAN